MSQACVHPCAHDDASRWLKFAGSRGQRPLFFLLCFPPPLFTRICLFPPFSSFSPLPLHAVRFDSSPAEELLASQLTGLRSRIMSAPRLLRPVICSVLSHGEEDSSAQSVCSVFFFFLVFFIQLQIKVLRDNATFTVCLWFLRDATALEPPRWTGKVDREWNRHKGCTHLELRMSHMVWI